jgi:DNA-binding transcriptional ArsR family regulator
MLSLVAAAAPTLAGSGSVTIYEVPITGGVPDVVAVVLDTTVLSEQPQRGFITDPTSIATLLFLSDALTSGRSVDVKIIASAVGISPRRASSAVLPGLAERGLVHTSKRGKWEATKVYRSPAHRIITVEAKLRDWRRGLAQAARHAVSADASWLVLDAAHIKPARAASSLFRSVGVGLASLDDLGNFCQLVSPVGEFTLRLRRELLAQRAASLYYSGANSGPVGHVFGRTLTPTIGADPRLVGAGAR